MSTGHPEDDRGNDLDRRFCDAALDGLKSYARTEFTLRFLQQEGLPAPSTLGEMWAGIERWLRGSPSRCLALLEYVDELRMWGRQRVMLFEVDETYAADLSEPARVRALVGRLYDVPVYHWEAERPFVAHVRHGTVPGTEAPALIFKLIELRKYDLLVDDRLETFEERATDFFVVNTRDRYAELRIQELPTGARRNLEEERDLLRARLAEYLDFERLKPVEMGPVMGTMVRRPIFPVTAASVKFVEPDSKTARPEIVVFLEWLLGRPIPREIRARYECRQDVLGRRPVHFRLNGSGDYVAFGGIADPARINEVLSTVVDVSRGVLPPLADGDDLTWLDVRLRENADRPRVQAALLSAGAIAATIIWVVIEGVGNYVADEWTERLLRGYPTIIVTVPVEIAWLWSYYGTRRVIRSFKVLLSLPRPGVWVELYRAWKRRRGETPTG